MFKAADQSSIKGRTSTFRRAGWYLALLVLAALGSSVNWTSQNGGFDIGATFSTVAFLGALVLALSTFARRPETQWYEGRAGAESIKSLSWLFVSGGDPFPAGSPDAESVFLARLQAIKNELAALTWLPARDGRSPAMEALRSASWAERKNAYLQGRIKSNWTGTETKPSRNESVRRV